MVTLVEPDDIDIEAVLEQFDRDWQYLSLNRAGWLNLYSDCWVVVHGEKLISHAETLDQALANAREVGVTENAAVDLITSSPVNLLL